MWTNPSYHIECTVVVLSFGSSLSVSRGVGTVEDHHKVWTGWLLRHMNRVQVEPVKNEQEIL